MQDRLPVAGEVHVGLDDVSALLDGEFEGFERVVGGIPGGAAVSEYERLTGEVALWPAIVRASDNRPLCCGLRRQSLDCY